MKMTEEEKRILEEYESDQMESIGTAEIRDKYKEIAKDTMRKNSRINIRIPQRVLDDIKVKALEQGLPYQTLISSILYKYSSGKLKES